MLNLRFVPIYLPLNSREKPVYLHPITHFLFNIFKIFTMAKSNSFFGLRRGSTKSLTFSVYQGQQVTKDRVTEVKNPRTESQMLQRMFMQTTVVAYSAMREICDHSFQGVTYGAQSMNRFMAENARLVRAAGLEGTGEFNCIAYGNLAMQPGRFLVSDGTLGQIDDNSIIVSENLGAGLSIKAGESITVADVKNALALADGDYFTIVALYGFNPAFVETDDALQPAATRFEFVRLYVPFGKDATVVTTANIEELFAVEKRGSLSLSVAAVGGEGSPLGILANDSTSPLGVLCATCIKSAKVGSSWARSRQTMKMSATFTPISNAAAFSTWPVGASKVLNGGDVNE